MDLRSFHCSPVTTWDVAKLTLAGMDRVGDDSATPPLLAKRLNWLGLGNPLAGRVMSATDRPEQADLFRVPGRSGLPPSGAQGKQ